MSGLTQSGHRGATQVISEGRFETRTGTERRQISRDAPTEYS
jgi:hypothetical protein